MKKYTAIVVFTLLCCVTSLLAQDRSAPGRGQAARGPQAAQPDPKSKGDYSSDIVVVHDAQEQALDQAQTLEERAQDARIRAATEAAVKEMERALTLLEDAKKAPEKLPEALAAEQAAYQSLLKLAAREYQVMRSRNQRGSGSSSSNQRNQRQLDQLELKQSENRYETQRQATPQQSGEQREQLQVLNRLKELAQRQQNLNERIKELQTALQEAKSDQEREDIRRRLKRLREEEQQMLADLDELRQRMDQPQNQSQMAEARQQLDRTRGEVQHASEALGNESVSQALASGTRAERELEQMRDEFRKKNSSQFAEEMRQMRGEARELAQKEEDIGKKLESLSDAKRKTLTDSEDRKALASELDDQKKRLTNLVAHATQVTEHAENVEPLLSKQLYDTLRKANQEDAKNITDTRDELMKNGRLTRGAYDTLQSAKDGSKKPVEVAADLLRKGHTGEASDLEQRARQSIENLKQGIEHAAESVLGDDTEALRMAKRELDDLAKQVEEEMAQANPNGGQQSSSGQTNQLASAGQRGDRQRGQRSGAQGQGQQNEQTAQNQGGQQGEQSEQAGQRDGQGQRAEAASDQNSQSQRGQQQAQNGNRGRGQRGQRGQRGEGNQPGQARGQQDQQDQQQAQANQQGQGQGGRGQNQSGQQADQQQQDQQQQAQGQGGQRGGGAAQANNQGPQDGQRAAGGTAGGRLRRNFFDGNGQSGPEEGPRAPITGEDYAQWSDRLRDVEEMLDAPELRNEVAEVRERARSMRVDFKRHSKTPQWDLVKSQIVAPLAEVRERVKEELARRESKDSLVPIDRDPVPHKFSDLVRRYYERLGSTEQPQ